MAVQTKIGIHSLLEIDKLVNLNNHISDIGNSIDAIFYTIDTQNHINYLNDRARMWMNVDLHPTEEIFEIDINSYFEDQIAWIEYKDPDHQPNSVAVKYNLQKVWFPADLDFKLCLISSYPSSTTSDTFYTIVPLQDWKHLKKRLVSLIEEEEFIQANSERYHQLTKREKEVVKLNSIGLNNIEISDRLCISKHSVEQHRKNGKRKLNISTIAELSRFGRAFNS